LHGVGMACGWVTTVCSLVLRCLCVWCCCLCVRCSACVLLPRWLGRRWRRHLRWGAGGPVSVSLRVASAGSCPPVGGRCGSGGGGVWRSSAGAIVASVGGIVDWLTWRHLCGWWVGWWVCGGWVPTWWWWVVVICRPCGSVLRHGMCAPSRVRRRAVCRRVRRGCRLWLCLFLMSRP